MTRGYKISWMSGRFQVAAEQDKIIDKEKLIANFCIELSSTRKTALELIKLFEHAGKIKVIGNEILSTRLTKPTELPNLEPIK